MRASWFDLVCCILGEFLEILFEHLCHFLQGFIKLFFAAPGLTRVQDLCVDSVNGSRVLKVEDGESCVFSISEFSTVNRVNNLSGVIDWNSLRYGLKLPFQLHNGRQSIRCWPATHWFHAFRSCQPTDQRKPVAWMAWKLHRNRPRKWGLAPWCQLKCQQSWLYSQSRSGKVLVRW